MKAWFTDSLIISISCWCSDTTKKVWGANDMRGNVVFFPPCSQHAPLLICHICIWLQEHLRSRGPLKLYIWGDLVCTVCSVFYRLKEKHGPPTSPLLQGLTLPGKQFIQGNHMHTEACVQWAQSCTYTRVQSRALACVTPTRTPTPGADTVRLPLCLALRQHSATCFNFQH